jgi:hypothetical protein
MAVDRESLKEKFHKWCPTHATKENIVLDSPDTCAVIPLLPIFIHIYEKR